jgi:hypothetical protein
MSNNEEINELVITLQCAFDDIGFERLIRLCEPRVSYWVNHWSGRTSRTAVLDRDDFRQSALIVMRELINTFDPKRGGFMKILGLALKCRLGDVTKLRNRKAARMPKTFSLDYTFPFRPNSDELQRSNYNAGLIYRAQESDNALASRLGEEAERRESLGELRATLEAQLSDLERRVLAGYSLETIIRVSRRPRGLTLKVLTTRYSEFGPRLRNCSPWLLTCCNRKTPSSLHVSCHGLR